MNMGMSADSQELSSLQTGPRGAVTTPMKYVFTLLLYIQMFPLHGVFRFVLFCFALVFFFQGGWGSAFFSLFC